jgi:HD-GYP domain-containing protein (c-di-GMP phosphodiesterase class II)
MDFNSGLDDESLVIMYHRSYVTFVILSKIAGLKDLSLWAANHHKKLGGSGYPFKRNAG